MVRLRRGAPPAGLLKNGAIWTRRWIEIHSAGDGRDWATKNAKKILSADAQKFTAGKCAFCESLLGVTTYPEVEHYVAKTVQPAIAFEWENLFPICRLCNNAKSDAHHGGVLLKPDVDDPESLLWLNPDSGELQSRPFIQAPLRLRAERTFELCGLQRGQLCTKRINVMNSTIRWLRRLADRNGELDEDLEAEWVLMIDPAAEHKFVIRHVFETHGRPELAALDRVAFSG